MDYGRVAVEPDDLPPLYAPDAQAIVEVKYVWRPSPALAKQLPDDFGFAMRCVTGPDRRRRFYPSSVDGMIATGFAGGLAILSSMYDLNPAQRQSYRGMYLLFQRLRKTREHFENQLLNATSLRISRIGRDVAEEHSILPTTLGMNARGEGELWRVSRLLQEGRALASAIGIERPTENDCVHYGLVAGARLNPLYLRDDEVLPLVRLALYESIVVDSDEADDPTLLGFVVQRALAAILNHTREPAADFDAWMSGPKNSFVKQLAVRKLQPGGVLNRDAVRQVLQDLGWDAYRYVGDCIDLQLRLFLRLLSESLTADERRWFEQMNLKQPHFGNLPLVLLAERFPFVRSVVWEIWENPDQPEPVAVFHRLLDYYAEMASARRPIDRRVQSRRAGAHRSGGQVALTVSLPRQVSAAKAEEARSTDADSEELRPAEPEPVVDAIRSTSADDAAVDVFAKLAALVREKRQVRCGCASPEWDNRVSRQEEGDATIDHSCTNCGYTTLSMVTLNELKDLATAALES